MFSQFTISTNVFVLCLSIVGSIASAESDMQLSELAQRAERTKRADPELPRVVRAEMELGAKIVDELAAVKDPVVKRCNVDGAGAIEIELPFLGKSIVATVKQSKDQPNVVKIAETPQLLNSVGIGEIEISYTKQGSGIGESLPLNEEQLESRLSQTTWSIFERWRSTPNHKYFTRSSIHHFRSRNKAALEGIQTGVMSLGYGSSTVPSAITDGLTKSIPKFWAKINSSCQSNTPFIGAGAQAESIASPASGVSVGR